MWSQLALEWELFLPVMNQGKAMIGIEQQRSLWSRKEWLLAEILYPPCEQSSSKVRVVIERGSEGVLRNDDGGCVCPCVAKLTSLNGVKWMVWCRSWKIDCRCRYCSTHGTWHTSPTSSLSGRRSCCTANTSSFSSPSYYDTTCCCCCCCCCCCWYCNIMNKMEWYYVIRDDGDDTVPRARAKDTIYQWLRPGLRDQMMAYGGLAE